MPCVSYVGCIRLSGVECQVPVWAENRRREARKARQREHLFVTLALAVAFFSSSFLCPCSPGVASSARSRAAAAASQPLLWGAAVSIAPLDFASTSTLVNLFPYCFAMSHQRSTSSPPPATPPAALLRGRSPCPSPAASFSVLQEAAGGEDAQSPVVSFSDLHLLLTPPAGARLCKHKQPQPLHVLRGVQGELGPGLTGIMGLSGQVR